MRTILFVLLAGCGVSVTSTPLVRYQVPENPARPHAIEFVTRTEPYVAVALLHATDWPGGSGPAQMILAIRDKAERAGCDAVQLASFDPSPKGHAVIDAYCLRERQNL